MPRGTSERNQVYPFRPASGDPSRPQPPPEPNVLGHGMYMHHNVYAPSQQPQAQPNFPSDYAGIPRAFIGPHHQQGQGYVNNQVNDHSRPAFSKVFPQAHPHAHTPHSAQTPRPYGGTNPDRLGSPEPPHSLPALVPRQSLTPRGLQPYGRLSSGSYEFGNPHALERLDPPQISTPHARPSARPQQLYDVGRYQAPQLHAPASQHYPPLAGQKKALLVGINYEHELRLNHGVSDAKKMARFLQEHLYFYPDSILILTDGQHDRHQNLPTEANILAGMHWLVEGAQPGDSLFFYFSGHATRLSVRDCQITADNETPERIVDTWH